jgi:hypothetical protein
MCALYNRCRIPLQIHLSMLPLASLHISLAPLHAHHRTVVYDVSVSHKHHTQTPHTHERTHVSTRTNARVHTNERTCPHERTHASYHLDVAVVGTVVCFLPLTRTECISENAHCSRSCYGVSMLTYNTDVNIQYKQNDSQILRY